MRGGGRIAQRGGQYALLTGGAQSAQLYRRGTNNILILWRVVFPAHKNHF